MFVGRGVLSAVVGLGRLGDRQSSPSGPLRWPSRDPGDGQDPVLKCNRASRSTMDPKIYTFWPD